MTSIRKYQTQISLNKLKIEDIQNEAQSSYLSENNTSPLELLAHYLFSLKATYFSIEIISLNNCKLFIEQVYSSQNEDKTQQPTIRSQIKSLESQNLQANNCSKEIEKPYQKIMKDRFKRTNSNTSALTTTIHLKLKNINISELDEQQKRVLENLLRNITCLLITCLKKDITCEISNVSAQNRYHNLLSEKKIIGTGMFENIDISTEHPALARALTFISDNFQKNISMTDLADACYISTSHLSSLLKHRFGVSFKKILTHMRIEKAKMILERMPMRQITLVCSDAGFSDLSHFEKTFKRHVGLSPSIFRKQLKAKNQALSITKSDC
jgi:YesN/AraC family two-component response regulator